MRRVGWIVCGAALLVGCLEANPGPFGAEPEPEEQGWESFSIAGIRSSGTQAGPSFTLAHADSSFRMGLLNGPAGTSIGLISHRDNAVYYVAAGRAELRVAGDSIALTRGMVIFVPGDTEHRIRGISQDLDIVAYLARGLAVANEPEPLVLTAEDIADVAGDTNEWRQFVESSTLGMGVYTLPKGGGGDEGLTHDFVEFKLVMEGGGRLDVGAGGIEAGPGAMVLIEDDVRHQFRRVSEDLAILVVWKR